MTIAKVIARLGLGATSKLLSIQRRFGVDVHVALGLRAIAEAALEASWSPIETAPKGERLLELYGCEYGREWFGTGYWHQGAPGDHSGWVAHSYRTVPNDASGAFAPTHWRRLSKSPSGPGDQP